MRLQRIELRRVPGINPAFTLDDLAPGINVILGPNGSGKSSLCRAVRVVLWPGREEQGHFEVVTVWDDPPQRTLHGERDGKRVAWQIDGVEGDAPTLPAAHLARCYTLDVRDLLQDKRETDSTLAHDIRVQMSGGYDLDEVRADRFPEKTRGSAKEFREWEQKQAATRKIEGKFRSLAESEGDLPDLERRRDEAQQAVKEDPLFAQLIELARARKDLEGIEVEIASLPAELGDYNGEEQDQLDELEKDLAAATDDVERIEAELTQAQESERQTRLSDQDLNEAELKSWETRVEALRTDQRGIETDRRNAAVARASLEDARAQLQGHVELEPAPQITSEALSRAETLIDQLHHRTAERSGIHIQIQSLDVEDDAEPEIDPKENAVLLRAWLAAGGTGISARALHPVLIGILLTTLAALLASFITDGWPGLVGAAAGVTTAVLVVRLLLGSGGDDRVSMEAQIRDRGLRAPSTWSRSAVLRTVDELDREASRLNDAAARRDRIGPLREQKKNLTEAITVLEARRTEYAKQFGIEIDSDLTLIVFAQRARNYAAAVTQVSAAEESAETVGEALAKAMQSAHEFLGPFGYEPAGDVDRLAADLGDLDARRRDFAAARIAIESKTEALKATASRKQKVEKRVRDLYTKRGLAVGDRDGLLQTLNQHPEWEALQARHRDEVTTIVRLEQKFSDRPDLIVLSEEEATAQRDRTKAIADKQVAILGEISDIENRVKMAREGEELTEAMEARDAAKAGLEDARAKAVHGAAGRFLLDQVAEEHEQTSRPPVLQRAMDDFGAFTRNQYELIAPKSDGDEFRARDTSTGKGLALSELSDGTRIQLLLAVRLAFALNAEGERKLPLMLDEALSTADPERFRAVADSLTLLASEGRQIFYLTANPADAAHWGAIGKTSNVAPAKIIDLGKVRGLQAAAVDSAALAPPERPTLPHPDGKSPADYAKELQVPAIDFAGPVESLHLYYLLSDNLDALYEVMRRLRIQNVGQWMSFSHSTRATGMLKDAMRTRLDGLARCARSVFEARAIGCGRPIDGEVLDQSGAVSPVFSQRIADLTRDLGGDAAALLESIDKRADERTKGFYKAAIESLRTYFDDNGYIDGREKLDASMIRLRALAACADDVAAGSITTDDCHALVDRLL